MWRGIQEIQSFQAEREKLNSRKIQDCSAKFSLTLESKHLLFCQLMDVEDALRFIENRLADQGKRLNDVQRVVFRGAWQGKSYKEIRQDGRLSQTLEHIRRNVGYELWQLISEAIEEKVSLKNLQGPIERVLKQQKSIDPDTDSSQNGHLRPEPLPEPLPVNHFVPAWADMPKNEDWGTAPDVSLFYGRDRELRELDEQIRFGCRLVLISGIGGVGKTALATRLARQVRGEFEFLIWRSLGNWQLSDRPCNLAALLTDLTEFFSEGRDSSNDILNFVDYLQNHRCLIVLDGWETVLRHGVYDGSYREDCEAYREFLRRVGRAFHRSCLILTSWEKPREVVDLERSSHYVFSKNLDGLGELAGKELLVERSLFFNSESDWRNLIRQCEGNPFVLSVVADRVRHLFSGDLTDFLAELQHGSLIFSDIQTLLKTQFDRLSTAEQTIVRFLAEYDAPATLDDTEDSLNQPISRIQLQDVLESLLRRSLLEIESGYYRLHPLMADYARTRS